jgi:hypothetical protein
MCMCVCVGSECARVRVLIARPAPRVAGRARVVALGATGGARARWAAGVTWTSRTLKAGWAARFVHTSVIDAAGAIYVIGGYGATTYEDVWASTDGGARPDYVEGVGRGRTRGHTAGVREGYSRGYFWDNQGF